MKCFNDRPEFEEILKRVADEINAMSDEELAAELAKADASWLPDVVLDSILDDIKLAKGG